MAGQTEDEVASDEVDEHSGAEACYRAESYADAYLLSSRERYEDWTARL
jgi:hypothetical protein